MTLARVNKASVAPAAYNNQTALSYLKGGETEVGVLADGDNKSLPAHASELVSYRQ